jgi:hypothetical protein
MKFWWERRGRTLSAAPLVAVLILADPIGAAGATRLLAKGGDWAALAYAGSETAPPYVCFVLDPTAKLDLRAERGLTELEIGNWHWSLPRSAIGVVQVTIGPDTRSFPIDRNTNKMVAAKIDGSVLPLLLDEMGKGTVMRVAINGIALLVVPLAGSKVAMDAFQICAGIRGNAAVRGQANPSQGQATKTPPGEGGAS